MELLYVAYQPDKETKKDGKEPPPPPSHPQTNTKTHTQTHTHTHVHPDVQHFTFHFLVIDARVTCRLSESQILQVGIQCTIPAAW